MIIEIKELFLENEYVKASNLCKELLQSDSDNSDYWYYLFLADNNDYVRFDYNNMKNELAFNKALENASRRKSAKYMSEYNFYKSISKCNGLNKLFRYAQYKNIKQFINFYIENIKNITFNIDDEEKERP